MTARETKPAVDSARAWVKKLEYGELEGKSNENVIEIMTICYQYFDEN